MEKIYSGKQVEKAGIAIGDLDALVEDSKKFEEVMSVLSYWRSSHEEPLELALAIVEKTVLKNDRTSIFAKRLKRYISIFTKLNRFNKMSLKTMQDIGGCRAIISNEKKLRQSVRDLKKLEYFKGLMENIKRMIISSNLKTMVTEAITLLVGFQMRMGIQRELKSNYVLGFNIIGRQH